MAQSPSKRGKNEPEPRPIIIKKIIADGHGGHHGGAWIVGEVIPWICTDRDRSLQTRLNGKLLNLVLPAGKLFGSFRRTYRVEVAYAKFADLVFHRGAVQETVLTSWISYEGHRMKHLADLVFNGHGGKNLAGASFVLCEWGGHGILVLGRFGTKRNSENLSDVKFMS